MGNMTFVSNMIEKRLLDLHCAYVGKVISVSGDTARVQPLGLIKSTGGTAVKQAVVEDVPIACRYKISTKTLAYTDENGAAATQVVAVPSRIGAGDLVVCVCADRDITEAVQGKNVLPPAGMHGLSDSIIVAIL